MKKFLAIFVIIFLTAGSAFSAEAWINDLRSLFLQNKSVIYAVNLRTFNAKDIDGNGIIDVAKGEESGNFINAIDKLDDLSLMGVNTVHLLPITPVGKVKALGTAGSLYSPSDFTSLNPQLASKKSALSLENQAIKFINECHRRNIRVIVDLPSCGSYDLFLKHPEFFKKDKSGNPIVPTDWTDVRLLDTESVDVYNMYKDFINMVVSLDVDGIRADVATIKTSEFWKNLISYTRKRNPQFLFLAEASDSWREPPSEYAVFTPYDKLLDAGFDGYYGSYFNLKDWKSSKDLFAQVKLSQGVAKKYAGARAVIGNFSTHDELSPMLIDGEEFAKMIIWLNSTLPLNPYYVDGFPTGDNYVYFWANKKAAKTFTDDDYYFVHRGKLDIFNFSRPPGGSNGRVLKDFVYANKFRNLMLPVISQGNFIPLRSSGAATFAFARSYNKITIVVIGNLESKKNAATTVCVKGLKKEMLSVPVKLNDNIPIISNGKIKTNLAPNEVVVLMFQNFEMK